MRRIARILTTAALVASMTPATAYAKAPSVGECVLDASERIAESAVGGIEDESGRPDVDEMCHEALGKAMRCAHYAVVSVLGGHHGTTGQAIGRGVGIIANEAVRHADGIVANMTDK